MPHKTPSCAKSPAIPEPVSSTSGSGRLLDPGHGRIQAKPVVRFIRENFQTVIEGSGYSLMMRNRPEG